MTIEVQTPVLIPTQRYTSPDWAALEEHRLWPPVGQLACSADHVAAPGDYFALLQRAPRGLHQPGMTHLRLSSEECRIINFHRNLEHMVDEVPR